MRAKFHITSKTAAPSTWIGCNFFYDDAILQMGDTVGDVVLGRIRLGDHLCCRDFRGLG